jgi:hypothetical protein
MATITYNWEKIWDCGSTSSGEFYGHTIFLDGDSGRFSICDMSGEFPEETDDGVLWLDFTRPFMLCISEFSKGICFRVPLLTAWGDKTHTLTPAKRLWELIDYFKDHNIEFELEFSVDFHNHIKDYAKIYEIYLAHSTN